MHARWLIAQKFHHPAQQIVFQDHIEVINAAGVRLAALEQQLRDIVPSWTMAPLVAAYQALRGVSFLVAATSPKTRRCAYVAATDGSSQMARSPPSRQRRSPARWPPFCGLSGNKLSQGR
jgi:hypothetical protein